VDDFVLVLVVALAGTVNPSAGNVSVFVPLEHAALSREATEGNRTWLFGRYTLVGALAAALGALATGLPGALQESGLDRLTAIKAMFVLYALLGGHRRRILFSHPRQSTCRRCCTESGAGAVARDRAETCGSLQS
jgi:hypothetical protein